MGNHEIEWGQAGVTMKLEEGVQWLKVSEPMEEWPPEADMYKEKRFGDRRQELVFIGADMSEEKIRTSLDKALLNDREMNLGPTFWKTWPQIVESKEEVESARTDSVRGQ